MEFIIIYFWGWAAWYLTGTDDFLVFYSIYYNTSSSKNHRLAVLGLITSVLFMILLVIVSNIIVIIVPLVKQYTFVGGIIPIYLGIKTIISSQNNESIDLKKSSYFLLAFLGIKEETPKHNSFFNKIQYFLRIFLSMSKNHSHIS